MDTVRLRRTTRKRIAVTAQGAAPIRWFLCGLALACVGVLLVLPLIAVFVNAFSLGAAAYLKNVSHPETLYAIKLTLLTAAIAVPLNTAFGIVAAWLIAKFDFWGKNVLVTVIDLPFSVPPVVSGYCLCCYLGAKVGLALGCQTAI